MRICMLAKDIMDQELGSVRTKLGDGCNEPKTKRNETEPYKGVEVEKDR